MAVNVSTVLSICLYCKASSESNGEKEFHEIFDDVGLELQLPTLVEKFFHRKLQNHSKQLLCEDCVNRLIELYDLEEHGKEENGNSLEQNDELAANLNGISPKSDQLNSDKKGNIKKLTTFSLEDEKTLTNDNQDNKILEVKKFQYDDDMEIDIPQAQKKDDTKFVENVPSISEDDEDPKIHDIICAQEVPQQQQQPKLEVAIDLIADADLETDNQEIEPTKAIENGQYEDDMHQEENDKCDDDDELESNDEGVLEDNIHHEEIDKRDEDELESNDEVVLVDNINQDEIDNRREDEFISADEEVLELQTDNQALIDLTLNYNCNTDDQEIEANEQTEYDNERECEGSNQTPNFPLHNEDQDFVTAKDNLNGFTDNGNSVLEVDLMENLANKDNIEGTGIPSLELDIGSDHQDQINVPEEQKQNNIDAAQSPASDFIFTDQNEFLEEHVYDDVEEESLLECQSQNSVNGLYSETVSVDNIEELVESVDGDVDDEDDFKLNASKGNNNIDKESQYIAENFELVQIADDGLSSNVQDTEITQDDNEMVEEVLIDDDTMFSDEEYIIEEITCVEEFDCVDLSSYLDNVLLTEFEKLELKWSVECKLCLETYETLQDVLNHSCTTELFEQEQPCCCIFKDCDEIVNDVKTLARHLVIQHYDNLNSLSIYSRCTDCDKNFSNFIELNKHSCCRNIKRKSGIRKYCRTCCMDFASLKRFVFHMQFHLKKHRPKVCLLCGALFKTSNDFFEHTQYNHEPELAMACVKCDRFFKNVTNYESHLELHDDSKYTFSCTYCPKKYTKKSGLNLHMDIYHNHKKKPLQCEYCDKELATNASYRNHMKSHMPDVQVPAIVCSECGLISDNSNFMKEHLETVKDSACYSATLIEEVLSAGYTCENCSIDFRSKEHLQKHRLSTKHNNKLFYCYVCRKAFQSFRHMRNHSINHKDYEQCQDMFPIARFYMCDIHDCQESYPLWSSLYYHKKRPHKNDKSKSGVITELKCQFCQHIFQSKMSLAVHVARSHNKTLIRCSHCNQSYKNEKLLKYHHAKFHTPVKCTICFTDFKNRRNLDSHQKLVHANEKRYFCRHCKKGYFYKSEMVSHEKHVHSDVLYKCEICNFITSYPKSLEIHLDKHNNKLNFQCTICSKSFGRKQLLTVHMKRHQETKEYVCCEYYEMGCNASFVTYNLMKTHIQKKHENSKDANDESVALKRSKRSTTKVTETIQLENTTTVTILDDNDTPKRRKIPSVVNDGNDGDFETDSIEVILESDISEEDIQGDHEFTIQYEEDTLNSCD